MTITILYIMIIIKKLVNYVLLKEKNIFQQRAFQILKNTE